MGNGKTITIAEMEEKAREAAKKAAVEATLSKKKHERKLFSGVEKCLRDAGVEEPLVSCFLANITVLFSDLIEDMGIVVGTSYDHEIVGGNPRAMLVLADSASIGDWRIVLKGAPLKGAQVFKENRPLNHEELVKAALLELVKEAEMQVGRFFDKAAITPK
ncbi:hypothetical protein K402DRAFT_451564 [Aulographum hederae CBS 113979]|uniref:Uncharacterized protein n=1 Tax=Aulographum hederae CBS 113979 TaxID=1176131 RepID=A0A6G1HA59_9PEZI|nr:hypothetical protein K402DRAFT_451564 [Aulographum hederae CBS 113979]